MLQRQQYEKEMKERDAAEGSEESDLEVFDDEKMDEDDNEKVVDVKGKGKLRNRTTKGNCPLMLPQLLGRNEEELLLILSPVSFPFVLCSMEFDNVYRIRR